MSDYAENLEPDLAKKYRFQRKAGWAAAAATFISGLITALLAADYHPLIPGTTVALLVLTLSFQARAATVRKQTARYNQRIEDRIARWNI